MGPSPAVILGVPGAMVDSGDAVNHYSSKAYAPLSREQVGACLLDRTLYLYGCVKAGCGKLKGSWRAFRAQLDRSLERCSQGNGAQRPMATTSGGASTADGAKGGLASQERAPSGLDKVGCDNISVERGAEQVEDPFGFSDLNVALDALTAGDSRPTKPKQGKRGAKKHKGRSAAGEADSNSATTTRSQPEGEAASVLAAGKLALPEFFLPAFPEPGSEHEGLGRMTKAERAHVDEIWGQYKETERELEGREGKMPESGGSWVGEVHEKCSSRWSDGGAFWRFKKRLDRCSEQCVRYSFGGDFLNPSNEAIDVPSCSACGSKRHSEFQIMPALISSILEAANWRDCGEQALVGNQATAMWEWATVAVYTCSRSCSGQPAALTYVEEVALVYMED